jgi:glycosyltransferase involved in cell wall biosynthesis
LWVQKRAGDQLVIHVTTADITLALVLRAQLLAYKQAGWRVVGASAPGPYVARLEESNIEHVPLQHATRTMALRTDLLALTELVKLFRQMSPSVVHTHTPKAGIYGRVAARVAGVPAIVNTVHGLYATPEDPLPKRAAVYTVERLAAFCSDAELVLNPEDADVLYRLGVPRRKVTVLGSGIDLNRFDPSKVAADERRTLRQEMGAAEGDVVVGVVGRLVWEKGYREVFEAARRLRSEAPSVRVVCVGPEEPDKPDRVGPGDLEEAQRNGVRWLGPRSDLHHLYAAFDLFVLASYREGFPLSLMEASAMALPVVATDIRGCRQVVDDGRTGLIVPPRDSAALAEAISSLAADPDRRAKMGATARAKAEAEFDEQALIRTTLATYGRLLQR